MARKKDSGWMTFFVGAGVIVVAWALVKKSKEKSEGGTGRVLSGCSACQQAMAPRY